MKADQEVTLTARVPARLTALAREGSGFRRGEPLARFESPEAKEGLEAARGSVTAAIARRDRARLQEARMESLHAAGVVSKSELEIAQVERQSAESGWSMARAQRSQWEEGTVLTASFDGFVVRRLADPGAVLQPGQPVLSVRSRAATDIVAAVPESQLGRLDGGRIEFQIGDGPWRPARSVRVEGMTDFATRTRLAHLLPAGGEETLEAGAFARVRIARASGDTPADSAAAHARIPVSSLVRRGALAGVYVIEEEKARLRWLRLGREEAGQVEVLAGLWPDEAIAVDPAGLDHGRAVRVVP